MCYYVLLFLLTTLPKHEQWLRRQWRDMSGYNMVALSTRLLVVDIYVQVYILRNTQGMSCYVNTYSLVRLYSEVQTGRGQTEPSLHTQRIVLNPRQRHGLLMWHPISGLHVYAKEQSAG